MRVLVTGSAGYIGTVLVPMLVASGHDVEGLDSNYFSRCTFVEPVRDIPTTQMDVRDVSAKMLEGFDAIIHLAGLSNDPLGDYDPRLTEDINTAGSIRLAQCAKAAGVPRLLFASSCSNYGASGDNFLTEDATFNPVTPYGVSKVRVEEALHALADHAFSPVYLRASTAYGLSPRIRFDLVVNNLTAWAFTTGRVYLKSDGTPWRPIVHVDDICRAYLAALEAPREAVHDQAFNVGTTTENYQIRELAEIVQEIVPGSRVEFAADAGPDKRCYRVDCNKIARALHGFKPQWTARRGVEQLYHAYKTIGLQLEDFEGPRFMRIAHMKALVEEGLLDANLRWKT
ncbi:NAD-dependent epimerase/dehydratase family protein [Thiococcus pfennigii]|uniref:NAD-dependent epimerase/dehydratase family protein n=1 Tax=Thiococcus pfennigii TaxID=1057 RepID=UPI0019042C22|nr:NAD(P)-dependent oxidoreductase [Thiococcus pfennigii]MBK1700119.1 NAD-dependent dehydratase [Thiococcus pfennigii]MBK1731883.1 NAD-dependent dehydratase [Thiococcus pfennigii]